MKYVLTALLAITSLLSAEEITIASYNCGGLSDHYDYLRAVATESVVQERYLKEPENMALNEKIQQLALKKLFSVDKEEQWFANREWERKGYEEIAETLFSPPTNSNSPNAFWFQKMNSTITPYNIRPIAIFDQEVENRLNWHILDLTKKTEDSRNSQLEKIRGIMAKRIFHDHLQVDILCLQEADYLEPWMFPENIETAFSDSAHSINGVAWNKDRLELVEVLGDIVGRGFAVKLRDKESGKILAVASGHISGCNPYQVQIDPKSGKVDSSKGDQELKTILQVLDKQGADLMLIGIDSNVTSLHPRLKILKEGHYTIDYENFLEATCSSPNQILNNRIDWIACKTNGELAPIVTNIPITGVGLNSLQTNISDHKPIAAKVST